MELRQRAATDRALPGDLRPFPSTRSRDTCLSGCPASRHLEILQLLYRDLRKQRFGLFTILDVKAQLAEKNKAGKTKEEPNLEEKLLSWLEQHSQIQILGLVPLRRLRRRNGGCWHV